MEQSRIFSILKISINYSIFLPKNWRVFAKKNNSNYNFFDLVENDAKIFVLMKCKYH